MARLAGVTQFRRPSTGSPNTLVTNADMLWSPSRKIDVGTNLIPSIWILYRDISVL